MPTWNSGGALFKFVLRAIMLTIGNDLHHFVIIDRFSSDDTVKIAKEIIGDKLVVVECSLDLAMARSTGIRLADTDVILMVDSDVILNPFLYHHAKKLLRLPKVGAVNAPLRAFSHGFFEKSDSATPKIGRVIMPMEEIKLGWLTRYSLSQLARGYLFAALIKRELLKDWKPPSRLSAYEDYHMSQHITRKGYLWIELADVGVLHLKEYKVRKRRFIEQGLWEGANARLCVPTNLALYDILFRIIFGIGKRDFPRRVGNLIGFLNYSKYRVWQR